MGREALTPWKAAGKPSAAAMSLKNGCRQAQVQGRAAGEWELLPQGELGCSVELQEANKDREGKEHGEQENGVVTRTSYHNSALIIPCLENTASPAGWNIFLG